MAQSPLFPMLLPTPKEAAVFEPLAPVSAAVQEWIRRGVTEAGRYLRETSAPEGWDVGLFPAGDSRGREAYEIDWDHTGPDEAVVHVYAGSEAGLRHAFATLTQLLRQYQGRLPSGYIRDEPGFAVRGVMLDVSRDKVPTMVELKKAIDLFAELKFNHLQLYTEHTFAYVGHEEAWRDASPITPAEARELDAYCVARGIELAPNQNCFGHLAHWLKLPKYNGLAEIEGDGAWKFLQWERRGPFSLCPTEPRAEAFVADLLGQLLPCFGAKLVNIGCDETFDVGWGRSGATRKTQIEERKSSQEEEDRGFERARVELYFGFVSKIAAICRRLGRRPMMWGDIALSHPEMLGLMPEGMIGLAWWYEPTEKFESWVNVLREHGHEAWVCPGTSSWRSFTGRTTERRGNIADAAEQGARAGATGFLVCDWGDLGHRQQWPVSLAGIAQAAEAAWNPDRARDFDARAASLHVFGDASGRVGRWLDELGDVDLGIRRTLNLTNASAMFNDLHPPVPQALGPGERAIKAPLTLWHEAREKLRGLAASRPVLADELVNQELGHTLSVWQLALDHAIGMRRETGPSPAVRRELADRARGILREHRELWLRRNRPGGLTHSSSYYEKVIADLAGKDEPA